MASLSTRVVRLDPRRLKLLERNARYMRQEVFARLVANIQRDGTLTSLPFAWRVHDDATQTPLTDAEGEPVYEVLSGNHRVKAALAAGLSVIEVLVTDDYLPPARRRAIQLSHNALVGEDDPALLKAIYEDIDEVDWRLYAGLDDRQLGLLERVTVAALSEPNLDYQEIGLVFLPDEAERVRQVWQTVKDEVRSKEVWLARWAEYDRALDALETAGAAYGVRNTATALLVVLEVFSRHLDELREGWLDEDGQPVEARRRVPLETVLGTTQVPAETAAELERAVQRLLGAGQIKERREVLEWLLEKRGETV
jgi:hypothetical protein